MASSIITDWIGKWGKCRIYLFIFIFFFVYVKYISNSPFAMHYSNPTRTHTTNTPCEQVISGYKVR